MTKYRQDTVYYGGKNKSFTLYKTLWTLKMGNTVKSSFDFMQCIQLSVFCGCWDAAYQTRWHTCAQEWCLFSFRCHMEGRWESNLWMKTHTHKKNKETIGQEIGANRRQNVKWNLCCPFGDQVRSAHIQLQSVILQTSTHLNISEDAQILFTVSSQSPTPLGFVHSDDLMSVRNALSFYSQL